MPYLLQLKERFTRYELKNILYFKNKYSIRIYELLKQYEKNRKKEINIKELRGYLGIKEGEYKRFDNFDRVILKGTKEEINEHTDIEINYEKNKNRQKDNKHFIYNRITGSGKRNIYWFFKWIL